MKKNLILLFILVILSLSFIFPMSSLAEKLGFVYSDYVLVNKFDEAFNAAKIMGKSVLAVFALPACGECIKFKEITLTDKDTADFLMKNFVVVEVNNEDFYYGAYPPAGFVPLQNEKISYSNLFKKYKVSQTPTIGLFSKKIEYMGNISGFKEPGEFKQLLELSFPDDYFDSGTRKEISTENALKLYSTLSYPVFLSKEEFFAAEKEDINEDDIYVIYSVSKEELESIEKDKGVSLKNVLYVQGGIEIDPVEKAIYEELKTGITSTYGKLSADEIFKLLFEEGNLQDFIVIDVRTPQEFTSYHIEGSLNIDFFDENFENRLFSFSKEDKFIIYCQSGGRSSKTAELLISKGFKYVYEMPGGIMEWAQKQYPPVTANY